MARDAETLMMERYCPVLVRLYVAFDAKRTP